MSIEKTLNNVLSNSDRKEAKNIFSSLIQINEYVGEVISINYEEAILQIHDHERMKVGGIPALSFLIATRVNPSIHEISYKDEDSSFILLRVMNASALHNHSEAQRIRSETAQRISGDTDKHWDSDGSMDTRTRVYLGYAGIKCRIIGTFYLDKYNSNNKLGLRFGSDLSNFYPNRGLKVYKPNGDALRQIVNYINPDDLQNHIDKYRTSESVKLGYIRYASTNRSFQDINTVPVNIYPADLLSQKTALFGMTRTGKSNTTKIIAKAVYELRYPKNEGDRPLKIGQVIFDPDGEYANANVQDKDGNDNASALKRIWKIDDNAQKVSEVSTYGITTHPNDPDRKLMLLNFFKDENLQIGKEIINNILTNEKYLSNFKQVSFEKPDKDNRSAITRYNRKVLAYRAVLARAGFKVANQNANIKGLFNKELIQSLSKKSKKDNDNDSAYQTTAKLLNNDKSTLARLSTVFETLDKFIRDKKSNYSNFESQYTTKPNSSGDSWADEDLKKVIGIFQYPNGVKSIGKALEQHSGDVSQDYADEIYRDLSNGKLVLVDQSTGSPELNKSSSKRIMVKIFQENQKLFIHGKTMPEILVYIEEAHNILPAGSDLDLLDIWVRAAKEGAKYKIGMVYATQEVSSIQKNILRNTANWFISHLNNTDETKELCKYYDFADFEPSIRRAQDKGFLRIKTLSNPFVIPVQVDRFQIDIQES